MLRALSLTLRLTLFFTGVAAAVVIGLGLLFMSSAHRHFIELDGTALEDKKQLIEHIFSHSSSLEDMRARLTEAVSHHQGLYVLVQDSKGAEFYRSEGFSPAISTPMQTGTREQSILTTWTFDGSEYHALRFKSNPAHSPSASFNILIAVITTHHKEFLSELQGSLATYALLATVVSGLLGWFAAHQGLAPLRAMKARAAGVTGQKMEERMPVATVPIEMADLARELNQMLDRLQDDFRRLSEFSSDLAHELRTPISNLLTQTQVALATRRDADTYRDILASNAEEMQRLGRMVSDMLLLAKTERGVDLPNKEVFPAAQEVQALLEFYEAVAEEKRIHLSTQGAGDILGDRLMFRRAVSNLLSNALRHTPVGGDVTVHFTRTPSVTEVAVENTGEIIDPKVLLRMFDRFYRADPARGHPDSGGTGLGLSITKAIVEAHGGTAAVSSNQDSTKVSLTFPLPTPWVTSSPPDNAHKKPTTRQAEEN